MPSPIEIRTRMLLTAAEQSAATAAENLVAATAATDAAYGAILASVCAAGHDSFEIGASVGDRAPARLRTVRLNRTVY